MPIIYKITDHDNRIYVVSITADRDQTEDHSYDRQRPFSRKLLALLSSRAIRWEFVPSSMGRRATASCDPRQS
jgi:hypothetical protein